MILGSKCLTLVFLENFGCETWRLYSAKLKKLDKADHKHGHNGESLQIVKDDSKEGRSSKHDIYYYMPQRQCMQNVFLFSTTAKKHSITNPAIMVRSSQNWMKGPIMYTDWTNKTSIDQKTPNAVFWKKKPTESFVPGTKLVVSNQLKEMYYPKEVRPTRKQKKTSFFHQSDTFLTQH